MGKKLKGIIWDLMTEARKTKNMNEDFELREKYEKIFIEYFEKEETR